MLNETLSIIQIILQLSAVVIALLIGRFIRDAKFWWTIILAFLLMTLRRVTALLINLNLISKLEGMVGIIDRVYLPLLISVFLVIGIYSLYKRLKEISSSRRESEMKGKSKIHHDN